MSHSTAGVAGSAAAAAGPKARAPPKRVVPSAVTGGAAQSRSQAHLFNGPIQQPQPHSAWPTPSMAAAAAAVPAPVSIKHRGNRAWAAIPPPVPATVTPPHTAWPILSAAAPPPPPAALIAPTAASSLPAAPPYPATAAPVPVAAVPAAPAAPAFTPAASTSRYDSLVDSSNFFSEQDLLGTDHIDYLFGRTHQQPRHDHTRSLSSSPQQTHLLADGARDRLDLAASPGRGGDGDGDGDGDASAASSAALQMQLQMQMHGLGCKSDFKTRNEVALYNDRERMRDGFMDLMRRFTERRAKNTGLGGAQPQHTHHHAAAGMGAGATGANVAAAAAAASSFLSPCDVIRPLVREFVSRSHPANYGWFALEIFATLLVARCWSGVEDGVDAQRRKHASAQQHASTHARSHSGAGALSASAPAGSTGGAVVATALPPTSLDQSARAYAHLAQLKARMDAPPSSSVAAERKQSIGGGYVSSAHSSAAPSPVSASSARYQQGLQAARTAATGMATPTHSSSRAMAGGHNAWSRMQQQQQQQQAPSFSIGFHSNAGASHPSSSSSSSFSSHPSVGAPAAPALFPPHLSFSFSSSGPGCSTTTPPELGVLFPELQEFFAAFLLESDSFRLVSCVRHALLVKLHQLCDVAASAPPARQGVSFGVNPASADSLRRTWHGRVLKLKLLAKFLSFISVLPQADLSRLAQGGGGGGGGGGDGAIGLVAAASAAAMDKHTFPPFVRMHAQTIAATGGPGAAGAGAGSLSSFASSAALVPSFSLPLHLYLSYALHSHSLSLFIPWLCAYLRVLRMDPVQMGTEYVRMLLQDMARISVQLKRRLRRAAIAEQLRRHHRQKADSMSAAAIGAGAAGAAGGLARTYSSPLHFGSSMHLQPGLGLGPGALGSPTPLSPLLTPLTTPGASPYPSPPPSGSGMRFARQRVEADIDTDAVTPPLSPRQMEGGGGRDPRAAPPSGADAAAGAAGDRVVLPADSARMSPLVQPIPGAVSSTGGIFSSPTGSLSAFGAGSPMPSGAFHIGAATPSPFTRAFAASPSVNAQGAGSSNSSSSTVQHASLLFLLLELRDLFEWLDLDVDTLSDEWERRSHSPGGVLLDPVALDALAHQTSQPRVHASPSPLQLHQQHQLQAPLGPPTSETTAIASAIVTGPTPTAVSNGVSSTTNLSTATAAATAAPSHSLANGRAPSTAKKSLMARFTQAAASHAPAAASAAQSFTGASASGSVPGAAPTPTPSICLATAIPVPIPAPAAAAPVRSASMAATTLAPPSVLASSSSSFTPLGSSPVLHSSTLPSPDSLLLSLGSVGGSAAVAGSLALRSLAPVYRSGSGHVAIDSIPSLVSESLIPSLLGKTLEQIRAALKRDAIDVPNQNNGGAGAATPAAAGAGAGGLLSSPGEAGSMGQSDVSAAGTLTRTVSGVSRENRRKITPVTSLSGTKASAGTGAGAGALPGSSSSSSPSPSPSALLDQLRPAFFQIHPELSTLLATVSAPLERHVRAEGCAIAEPLGRCIDQTIARFRRDIEAAMRQVEAGTGGASDQGADAEAVTPMQQLERMISGAEAALTSELYQPALAECTASVTSYLSQRTLSALQALASPSNDAGVLVTASLLGAKRSLRSLRESIQVRVRKTIDERVRTAVKKEKIALARWMAQQQSQPQTRRLLPAGADSDEQTGAGTVSPASSSTPPSLPISSTAAVAATAPLSPSVPAPPIADSVVSQEISIRVGHVRRCVAQLQSMLGSGGTDARDPSQSQSSSRPPSLSPASCLSASKSLLRTLLPLSICVAASQSTPLLAQQASFVPFDAEVGRSGSESEPTHSAPLLVSVALVLQRMEAQLCVHQAAASTQGGPDLAGAAPSADPTASPPAPSPSSLPHELSQCWLHLSQLDRAVSLASPQLHAATWKAAPEDERISSMRQRILASAAASPDAT